MSNQIVCANDNTEMNLVYQCKVKGVDTFHFMCPNCQGKAYIQIQNGRPVPVQLSGSPDEFRPSSVSPHEQLQIPVAYTVGDPGRRRTVPVEPMAPPPSAYTLDPSRQVPAHLHPTHPMHPRNIRRRMMGTQ